MSHAIKEYIYADILQNLFKKHNNRINDVYNTTTETGYQSKELTEKIKRVYLNMFNKELPTTTLLEKYDKRTLLLGNDEVLKIQEEAIEDIAEKLNITIKVNMTMLDNFLPKENQYLLVSKNKDNELLDIIKTVKETLINYNGENLLQLEQNKDFNLLIQNDIVIVKNVTEELLNEISDFIELLRKSTYSKFIKDIPFIYFPIEEGSSIVDKLNKNNDLNIINVEKFTNKNQIDKINQLREKSLLDNKSQNTYTK